MVISLSLSVSLSSSSFLCPHKFDSLCWGLIQVPITIKGYYHLFHQYNQSMPLWGPNMSWAHVVSKHFIHWLYFEIVLEPNQWYDAIRVWSCSSTIGPDGAPFIIYTGLPFPIPAQITVPISFVIVLWKLQC
jgi:hypothetical protein